MKRMIGIAVLISGLTAPANASWQYTRWGMSPNQVIAASSGAAQAGSGEKSVQGDATMGAMGTYKAGKYSFTAHYWFGGTGLSMVSLTLDDDEQCLALQRDLLAKYGEPIERTGSSIQRRMWSDKTEGNRVALISTGLSFCELQYAPLISAGL